MNVFDDIRPYHDEEVRPTIERLLVDKAFLTAIGRFRFSWAPEWLLRLSTPVIQQYLRKQTRTMQNVQDVQLLVENYMQRMSDDTISGLHVSGMENIKSHQPHLFISNHRDIAMDPALINWVLYRHQQKTLRIAIGDNLLSKPYVSDLMRLNKCFIVNRSATAPREKLKVAKHLSAYIQTSITNDQSDVWIAQREGRAKDGLDRTNSALIGMLSLNKPKQVALADHIKALNIVPVSISYEYDPCDEAKAKELYFNETKGHYQKARHEDAGSIAKGILGYKGDVHIHFGEILRADYQSTDEVVADIDEAIIHHYHLHPSNIVAYQILHGDSGLEFLGTPDFHASALLEHKQQFEKRLIHCDPRWREKLISMYANPVISQQTCAKQCKA